MEKKIILTISVLTSRKEDQVRRCLESLKPLREAVPSELIVVDTSEDPHMHDVVSEYADEVIPFHWINDFSAARNVGLKAAHGEWFLYLDDDEWFSDVKSLIRFFNNPNRNNYDGATYIQRNYDNMEGTQWDDAWVSRVAKIVPGLHLHSPIHEYFKPTPQLSMALKSVVEHYGYVYKSQEDLEEHYRRNVPSILKMIEEEPDETRWRLQLMLEYRSVKKFQELYDLGQECLEYYADSTDGETENAFAGFYAAKMIAMDGFDEFEKAYEICEEALSDKRVSDLGRAFFHLFKADYAMAKKEYRIAEQDALKYFKWKKYFDEHEEEHVMQANVSFVLVTFKDVYIKKCYSILICAGLKQGNPAYLKHHLKDLHFENPLILIYTYLVESVVEGMAHIKADKVFVKTLKTFYNNEILSERLEFALLDWGMEGKEGIDQIIRLLDKAGVDSAFMRIFPMRKRLCEETDELTDKELAKLLEKFTKDSCAYYKSMFSDEDREKGNKEMPGDYKAALVLEKIFKEEDLKKRLPMFKDVVAAYPPFTEAVKRYMRILGDRIQEQKKAETMQKDEESVQQEIINIDPKLNQMAQEIMSNIPMMLEHGMVGEAMDVIQQLKEMLPDNEQILEMEQAVKLRLS